MDIKAILSPDQGVDTGAYLQAPSVPTAEEVDKEVAFQFIAPTGFTPDNVKQEIKRLWGQSALVSSTDSILEEQGATPESVSEVQGIASRFGTPSGSDVEFGAAQQLAAEEGEELPYSNANEWTRAKNNVAQLGRIAASEINRVDAETLDSFDFSNPFVSASAYTGAVFAQSLSPFTAQRLASVLMRVDPTLRQSSRTGFADGKSAITVWQTNLVNKVKSGEMTVEQAEAQIKQAVRLAGEEAASIFDSPVQEQDIVTRLLGSLAELADNPDVELTNKVNAVVGTLENLFIPGTVATAAKAVGKGVKFGNAVRLSENKPGFLAASTLAGAKRAWAFIRNKELDTPRFNNKIKIEDLIGSFAIPRVAGQKLDDMPFLPNEFLPEADRAKAASDPVSLFGTHLTPRVTGTKLDGKLVDGGVEGTVQFGTTKGKGFKTQQAAERWAKQEFGGNVPWKAVNNGGKQWYVEATKSKQFGLEDINSPINNPLRPGYWLLGWMGKTFRVTEEGGNLSSNLAARESEKAAKAIRQLADPFYSMVAGSRARVADVLDKGDAQRKVFSIDELRSMKLNDTEILGYAAIRRAADVERQLNNVRLWHKYTGMGYRSFPVNGAGFTSLKVLDNPGQVVLQQGQTLDNIKAIDIASGVSTRLTGLSDNQQIVRFIHPLKTGERYGVINKSDFNKLADLPSEIVPNFPGYLPRPYRYPFYVKAFDSDGVATTMKPARSAAEADELVAMLSEQNPGTNIKAVRATELMDDVVDEDELAQMFESNLLWDNTRGPSRLTDVTGHTRMFSVEDRIQSMLADASYNAGLGRWALAQERIWQNTYGQYFQNRWTLGQDVGKLSITREGEQIKDEALNYAKWIQNVAGLGNRGAVSNAFRNRIADMFYNASTKTGLKLLATTGDNISGLSTGALSKAKTAAYVAFLSSNPHRQLLLQMTTIPSYLGVTGGLKYASVNYWKDIATLTAEFLAPGMGGKVSKESKELLEQWERSGVGLSVDNHTFALQTISDKADVSGASRIGDIATGSHRLLKNVGIDAGIHVEKMSAWLFSRNRWKELNPGKQIDSEAEKLIAHWAEDLSLNPNRSDILPMQKGALGFLTQFMTHQVKTTGRLFTSWKKDGAGPWTRRERTQMALANLAVWGFGGYGVGNWAREMFADLGLQPDVEEALTDGLGNYAFNSWVDAWTDTEGTDVALTESFSPVAHIGGTAKGLVGFVDMIVTGDPALLVESRWSAPALGLTKSMWDVGKFALMMTGIPDTEGFEDDYAKMRATGLEFARKFPVSNNVIKYIMAREYGMKFNAAGDPIAETTQNEALMTLFGVSSRQELESRRLQLFLYPPSKSVEEEEDSIRTMAREHAKYTFPYYDQVLLGQRKPEELRSLINERNLFVETGLPEQYRPIYVAEMQKMIDRELKPKMESYIEAITQKIVVGDLPATQDVITFINSLDVPEEMKQTLKMRIRQAVGSSENG